MTTATPVFIDTDAGWDDWCAILFLALNDTVEVVGISVNGCGECYYSKAFDNIRNLLALIGRENIPVFKGQPAPHSYSNVFPADFRTTMSGVYGIQLPKSNAPVETDGASLALQKKIRAYPNLTYLAIGGFTNLATYLNEIQSDFPAHIIAMGGAIGVPGNIADLFPQAYPYNKTAEWNMYIDPVAASKALSCSDLNPVVMVPLDAAYEVELTQATVDMFKNSQTAAGKFVYQVLLKRLQEAAKGGYKEYFYDPLAAAYVVDSSLGKVISGDIRIETIFDDEENDNLGRMHLVVHAEPPPVVRAFMHSPDAGLFYRLFSDTINGHVRHLREDPS